MRPRAYQRIAAAKRISWTISLGDLRKVEKTSKSKSTCTLVMMSLPSRHRPCGIIPVERSELPAAPSGRALITPALFSHLPPPDREKRGSNSSLQTVFLPLLPSGREGGWEKRAGVMRADRPGAPKPAKWRYYAPVIASGNEA